MSYDRDPFVTIVIGETIRVQNSSIPMLEAHIEIEAENDGIQHNDLLYLMPDEEDRVPSIHAHLDP